MPRRDVTDALHSLSVLALARGEYAMSRELQLLAESNDKAFKKYGHFLTEWYSRLNNAPEGSVEFWLADSMRRNLPVAERASYREDPNAFAKNFKRGLSKIKEEANAKKARRGMYLRFMRQALKIREMFK